MTRRRTQRLGLGVMTSLLAALVALPVGITSSATAAADADTAAEVPVRVMTYNIHWGMGDDNVRDLQRVADEISAADPDVLGLQEVDVHWDARSDFVDQARWLADTLDMEVVFAPILDEDPYEEGQPRRQFGTAILSAHPITATTQHEILRLPDWTTTGFPEAVVNVRGAMFRFYTTHLDWRADPALREGQVADTLDITTAQSGQKVLVGDLNAPPDAAELAPLWEHFVDAWTVAGDGPGSTYPAAEPVKRIDYVLTSPDVGVDQVSVVDSVASDHRAVVADLTLTRGDWGPDQ